jgi:hypothetical protein
MSDQPSDAPRPILILIGVVALVALAASMFIGITTTMQGSTVQHATAPAAQPHT